MNLIKITDLSTQLGLSSRSLRYYEHVGLIQSIRREFEKYRYYDTDNIERLKQIIVLRKMQISIKDIIRIFESKDMSTVVEVFVNRMQSIDEEVGALSELKRIISEFLQTMIQNGITKISAFPLLYEEVDKQLNVLEKHKPVTYQELSDVSGKLTKPADIIIVDLPAMHVLSSRHKDSGTSDLQAFFDYLDKKGIDTGLPGRHEMFEYQNDLQQTIIIQKVDSDFTNDGPFEDYHFSGGLFAVGTVYVDEDMNGFYKNIIQNFDSNLFYEVDYRHGGGMRHESLVESVFSPDEKREMVHIFVAVKKRLPDVSLYDQIQQIRNITVQEIEEASPVLWTQNIPMDKLIPESDWYYHVNEHDEGEYIPVIDTHTLSTGIKVKLPFRVDIEFKIDNSAASYGYGSDEGSICFMHGTNLFGINKGNYTTHQDEAVIFDQPVFGNHYHYPKIGKINPDTYNRLSWIVGEKYFAVIINNEVRFCGVHFPYMIANGHMRRPETIIITSGGTGIKYLKSVSVSQLKQIPKTKIKEGVLSIMAKQSNNIIPNIHRLITSDHGENYWFNGCAGYVMECLGESDYGYGFFAGLTGDVFAQVFSYDGFRGDGATDYRLSVGKDGGFIQNIFDVCGYASTFVSESDLQANPEMYLRTLMAYIDKGIPVIRYYYFGWGVFVGYEEYGKTLLFLTDNKSEPERISLEDALGGGPSDQKDMPDGWSNEAHQQWYKGWIFVGEKKETRELARIYRDVIYHLPELLTTKTDEYCFGAQAFRFWADEIESGRYDGMRPDQFNDWTMYKVYVCNLATNSSCCHDFLKKARQLNPDLAFLEKVNILYEQMRCMWNGWENPDRDDLETIGGGFNVSLEALQDKEKRDKIVTKIREFGDCVDKVVGVLRENLQI